MEIRYASSNKDAIYIGLGIKEVTFKSLDSNVPAKFYMNSAPAHKKYPTKKIGLEDAKKVHLGNLATSNKRTINQFIQMYVNLVN